MSSSASDRGGLKEVIFLITGEQVYKQLKFESGVHRVQRIPVTEANGRIHTSTVTVAVLPEAEEVDVQIDPQDLEVSVMRASGPGGQGVNTTDSAVPILPRPSGLMVYCADDRSQIKNKARAMAVLRSRLLKLKEDEEHAKYAAQRRTQIGTGGRSERIRTYNFPQNRMTDHRIGLTLYSLPAIMEGNIEPVIPALQRAAFEEKLAELTGATPPSPPPAPPPRGHTPTRTARPKPPISTTIRRPPTSPLFPNTPPARPAGGPPPRPDRPGWPDQSYPKVGSSQGRDDRLDVAFHDGRQAVERE